MGRPTSFALPFCAAKELMLHFLAPHVARRMAGEGSIGGSPRTSPKQMKPVANIDEIALVKDGAVTD
jgi:hypothetical protein